VKTGFVEQLPAVFDKKREKEVVSLVDSLISAKRKNPEADVSEIENKLDEIVCEIFELSEDDKRVVLSH
jgi:hypothetical protein